VVTIHGDVNRIISSGDFIDDPFVELAGIGIDDLEFNNCSFCYIMSGACSSGIINVKLPTVIAISPQPIDSI
jgi:hypothetical protein